MSTSIAVKYFATVLNQSFSSENIILFFFFFLIFVLKMTAVPDFYKVRGLL